MKDSKIVSIILYYFQNNTIDDVARQLMEATGSCSGTQAEGLLQKLVGSKTIFKTYIVSVRKSPRKEINTCIWIHQS